MSGLRKINHTLKAAQGELFMTVQQDPVGEALVYKAREHNRWQLLLAIPLLHAIVSAALCFYVALSFDHLLFYMCFGVRMMS